MCSGCSGYFEGDGEDRDPGDDWAPEREARWPGDFAAGRDGLWEVHHKPVRTAPGEEDEYEILVSAACIIERRTIRANCCIVSQQAVPEGMDIWQGSQRERKRSMAGSAKRYQTGIQFGSERRTGSSAVGMCLMLWGLAGATALGLALWLAGG
jgi:hypothetical protein